MKYMYYTMLSSSTFLVFIALLYNCSAKRTSSLQGNNGGPIIFPDRPSSNKPDQDWDVKLLQTAGIRNASEILALLGLSESTLDDSSPIGGRKKANFAEQAVCEPEMTTVPVGETSSDGNEVYFPKCVRVPRCGGCCDISDRMACTPTKTSFKEVKRAKIRIRRSAAPAASSQNIRVEIHEECRCQCKVKEESCSPSKHQYSSELCKCVCHNSQEETDCRSMAPRKIWDNESCTCKCREQSHCPSGTSFSHQDCSCVST